MGFKVAQRVGVVAVVKAKGEIRSVEEKRRDGGSSFIYKPLI